MSDQGEQTPERDWRPISTAPRGMLLFCSMTATELRSAFFVDFLSHDGRCVLDPKRQPTHWMYLPEAPSHD